MVQVYMEGQLLYSYDKSVLEVSIDPRQIPELVRKHRTDSRTGMPADLSLPNPENLSDPYSFLRVSRVESISHSAGESYLLQAKTPAEESDSSRRHGFAGLVKRLVIAVSPSGER